MEQISNALYIQRPDLHDAYNDLVDHRNRNFIQACRMYEDTQGMTFAEMGAYMDRLDAPYERQFILLAEGE